MRNIKNLQKTITGDIEVQDVKSGISEAYFGGKLKMDGKDPLISATALYCRGRCYFCR